MTQELLTLSGLNRVHVAQHLFICCVCLFVFVIFFNNTKRGNEKPEICERQAIEWQNKMTKTNKQTQQINKC
jgi:hypothetical protein